MKTVCVAEVKTGEKHALISDKNHVTASSKDEQDWVQ